MTPRSDTSGVTRSLPVDPIAPDPAAVAQAADVLRDGGLVAFPTETVYGLGADARAPAAVARVFAVKGRPGDNPLIVHVGDAEAAWSWASPTPLARDLATAWWPGPLTLVLDGRGALPVTTTAGLATVALRVPAHPVARALLAAVDLPLAAPSANRSGRPSPTTAAHVLADLGGVVDVVLDGGPAEVGLESTVVDARGLVPLVLRPGAVTAEDLGVAADSTATVEQARASPGTHHRHYAPDCEVEVAPVGQGGERAARRAAAGARVGLLGPGAAPPGVTSLAHPADAVALARVLYDALRAAEAADLDVVVVEAIRETGMGRAVMDRLRRAAAEAATDA